MVRIFSKEMANFQTQSAILSVFAGTLVFFWMSPAKLVVVLCSSILSELYCNSRDNSEVTTFMSTEN